MVKHEPLRGQEEEFNKGIINYKVKGFRTEKVKSAVEGFLKEVMESNINGKSINILDLAKKWFEDVM